MIFSNARCRLIEYLSSKGRSLQTNMQNKIIGNPLRSKTQQGMIHSMLRSNRTISTIASLLFLLSPTLFVSFTLPNSSHYYIPGQYRACQQSPACSVQSKLHSDARSVSSTSSPESRAGQPPPRTGKGS